MIYSFYDPEHEARTGLGNLHHPRPHPARRASDGLPYVYLGYWVDGSARMQYKIRYRPLERLGPDGWQRFTDDEQSALIAAAAVARRDDALLVDGGSKDGTPGRPAAVQARLTPRAVRALLRSLAALAVSHLAASARRSPRRTRTAEPTLEDLIPD